jgi:hypothetical protein
MHLSELGRIHGTGHSIIPEAGFQKIAENGHTPSPCDGNGGTPSWGIAWRVAWFQPTGVWNKQLLLSWE